MSQRGKSGRNFAAASRTSTASTPIFHVAPLTLSVPLDEESVDFSLNKNSTAHPGTLLRAVPARFPFPFAMVRRTRRSPVHFHGGRRSHLCTASMLFLSCIKEKRCSADSRNTSRSSAAASTETGHGSNLGLVGQQVASEHRLFATRRLATTNWIGAHYQAWQEVRIIQGPAACGAW